jgi:hypothetical protein
VPVRDGSQKTALPVGQGKMVLKSLLLATLIVPVILAVSYGLAIGTVNAHGPLFAAVCVGFVTIDRGFWSRS